jgi:glycosyltransferase involved in cell wall biosynthesis
MQFIKMDNPLVSIIIPTYNRAHLINETLDSILLQTYVNWECIIIDDGSTDGSGDVIGAYVKKDSRFQYKHRPKHRLKGANACRNYGFEISKGEYIHFFDSDDIIKPSILKESIPLLTPNIDFVFFNYQGFYKEIKNSTYTQNNDSKEPLLDYFSGKINLATSAVVWRRNVIKGITFDERLKKSQELNFIFKIYEIYVLKPLIGVYLDENGYLMRKHEESIVSSFHKAKPIFLLSDIMVRNQISNYFNALEFSDVYFYQIALLEKSIRLYLFHSNLIDFGIFALKFLNKKEALLFLKLLFYKIIFEITNREHRLNKTINTLFNKGFYLKNKLS